jgi:hypothetical protein
MKCFMLFIKYFVNCEMHVAAINLSNCQKTIQEIGAGINTASIDLKVTPFYK